MEIPQEGEFSTIPENAKNSFIHCLGLRANHKKTQCFTFHSKKKLVDWKKIVYNIYPL